MALAPRPDRRQVGQRAEARAADHLRAAGLTLLHRNFHCRRGELDIVARHGGTLVVAEVRLRASARFGGAAASITRAKQRRIVCATRYLLARYPSLQRLPVRFDALLVPPDEGPIEWLQGAFDAY
ncbi:MAG: YraN family protein [Proteobacteria bacterium]|nr:YraN family protein [Pseudomonadota bacterium]